MKTENTVALPKPSVWSEVKLSGFLSYAAIWAFFIIFLIYPLIRLFYDSFTTEDGIFTIANFQDFFTDAFYLKSLMNSLILGVATVITTSIIGIAIAFLLLRYDFPGRGLFSYLTIIPMIMPPLVGVMGFVFILGRAGTVNIILQDYFGFHAPDQFHVRPPRGAPGGDAAPLSPDDPLHRRRHGEDLALPGRGGRERRVPGAPQVLGHHLPADHPRLRLRGASGLHLDLRRFRHAAGGGDLRPPGLPGLPEHRPVRGPAALQDGDRHLGHHGDPGHPLSDHRQEVRVDQGLQLPLLFGDRAEEALPPGAGGGGRLPGRSS